MEDLPPELVGEFYPYLDPESYRKFEQTGSRYKALGREKYVSGSVIVKDPDGKWVTKVDRRGSCLNSLVISDFNDAVEGDLIDGTLLYRFKLWNFDGYFICPISDTGYLEGDAFFVLNAYIFNYQFTFEMVQGIANGPINVSSSDPSLSLPTNLSFNNGILSGQQTLRLGDYFLFYDPSTFVMYRPIFNRLPDFLTNKYVPAVEGEDIHNLILPINLVNCKSLGTIQQDVDFIRNRLANYIFAPLQSKSM